MESSVAFPCPACGFLVFDEPTGSYAICPVCGWEDDHVQLRYPWMKGGANRRSLFEHQQETIAKIPLGIADRDNFTRDPNWRPLNEADCQRYSQESPETGQQYFDAAAEPATDYYWHT